MQGHGHQLLERLFRLSVSAVTLDFILLPDRRAVLPALLVLSCYRRFLDAVDVLERRAFCAIPAICFREATASPAMLGHGPRQLVHLRVILAMPGHGRRLLGPLCLVYV